MTEEQRKMSPAKLILSIGLSLILCLLMTAFTVAALLQGTVFNRGYMQWQLSSGHYAEYVKSSIDDMLISYGEVGGYDEDFCRSLLTKERLNADISQQLTGLYKGDGSTVSGDSFKDYVYQQLKKASHQTSDEAMQYFAQASAECYSDNLNLPLIRYAVSTIAAFRKPLWLAMAGCLVLTALTLMVLFRLRGKQDAGNWCAHAMGGTFLLLAIPTLVMTLSGVVKRLGFGTKALYYTATAYINHLLMLTGMAAALFLLGYVLLAIHAWRKEKQNISTASRHGA